ncbi:hypothetical protein [Streptomyces sp. NPDC003032]
MAQVDAGAAAAQAGHFPKACDLAQVSDLAQASDLAQVSDLAQASDFSQVACHRHVGLLALMT